MQAPYGSSHASTVRGACAQVLLHIICLPSPDSAQPSPRLKILVPSRLKVLQCAATSHDAGRTAMGLTTEVVFLPVRSNPTYDRTSDIMPLIALILSTGWPTMAVRMSSAHLCRAQCHPSNSVSPIACPRHATSARLGRDARMVNMGNNANARGVAAQRRRRMEKEGISNKRRMATV